MLTIHGIKNCDTMKKAMRWLTENEYEYTLVDYKKTPPDTQWLNQMITVHGIDVVVNKRGTTFRKLDEETKNNITSENAAALLVANPSMIKRPILCLNDNSIIGFSPDNYEQFLA